MRRRTALGLLILAAPAYAQARPRVVVVGGGFAGATAARTLHAAGVEVTLVEASAEYVSCPFSNAVIAGLREISAQRFGYEALRRAGITVVHQRATALEERAVRLADGTSLPFDRVVLAPGIDLNWGALPGYTEAAATALPHAWKAGPQTLLLRDQLRAMPDGGLVVMSVPANPYRCPPGPYERASLIAHYLKTQKPRSKLLVLDAKDQFSKQRLFEQAWAALYPNLEYVPLSAGGKVVAVDAATRTFKTEFGDHVAAVGNVIPPQQAGEIARLAGVADRSGWCPVDPVSFESKLRPGVHVVGDACIGGAMPKSAFAANGQARACGQVVAGLLHGEAPSPTKLLNTCYSLVAPDYGISIAGVYQPANGLLTDVPGAGGISPLEADAAFRAQEAQYAEGWYATITHAVFG
jgi:NADPH-dependent 2,4-dienoyl-CoA reductase/sulfur reductase-like enzyme